MSGKKQSRAAELPVRPSPSVELCTLCAKRNDKVSVHIPDGTEVTMACGAAEHLACDGFAPGNIPRIAGAPTFSGRR